MTSTPSKPQNTTYAYHNTALQTGLRRKNSAESRSTSSNCSMSEVVTVDGETVMALMMRIRDESQWIAGEKGRMEVEMGVLETMTQTLLQQNKALRQHYHHRSTDLQDLLTSLTHHTSLTTQSHTHQCHTYREHNVLLSKQIAHTTTQIKSHQVSIAALSHQLENLEQSLFKQGEILRGREVKLKLLERNVGKLEGVRAGLRLERLEGEVGGLVVKVNELRKKNIARLRLISKERKNLSKIAPEVKGKTIDVIKSNKKLEIQLAQTQADYQKFNLDKKTMQSKYTQENQKYLQIKSDYQANSLIYSSLLSKRKSLQQSTKPSSNSNLSKKKSNLLTELQTLKSSLISQTKNLDTLQSAPQTPSLAHTLLQSLSPTLMQSHPKTSQIHELKQKINTLSLKHLDTLHNELNPEKLESERMLEGLKREYEELEREVGRLEGVVAGMENPVREIVRLEIQLKRMKIRGR